MDEKIDIRTYPIPNWSSRQLSAVQNGKWTYFYNSGNNETVFDFEPYSKKTISILSQRDKQSVKNKTQNLNTSTEIRESNNDHYYYDSYQLFQKSIHKEQMQQQIFLTPTFSKPGNKTNLLKKHGVQKKETFVPSETNIVDKVNPILPDSPGLSVAKTKKENPEPINLQAETNDNEKTFCFNAPSNDIKNHNAYIFFRPTPKETSPQDKTIKLIEESISSKRTHQSISQLKKSKGINQRAFTFQMPNNKKSKLSSTYNFGDNSRTKK